MVRVWLAAYIVAHRDQLVNFDLAAAAWLGAPAGATLSALAFASARQGRLRGRLARWAIDHCWRWLFDEPDHCRKSFAKRVVG